MHVIVDRALCQDHGQCAIAAAAVFRMNEDGRLEYDSDPDDSLADQVDEAVDVCPAQAISVGTAP